MTWYRVFQLLSTALVHALARVQVVGKENLPRTGPFVLIANHQSVLDPIIVQVICPRPLHTLTKSTQFSGRVMAWMLPRLNALPTRRYRIDPQVVRMMLRRLSQGEAVGVYPEGERSWDGALQSLRKGTVRVLLKAGVPVIPCGVAGAYDVWPRWSRTPRRAAVRVEFGRPLRWPAMERRAERELALEDATETIRRALAELGAWERAGDAVESRHGMEGGTNAGSLPTWVQGG